MLAAGLSESFSLFYEKAASALRASRAFFLQNDTSLLTRSSDPFFVGCKACRCRLLAPTQTFLGSRRVSHARRRPKKGVCPEGNSEAPPLLVQSKIELWLPGLSFNDAGNHDILFPLLLIFVNNGPRSLFRLFHSKAEAFIAGVAVYRRPEEQGKKDRIHKRYDLLFFGKVSLSHTPSVSSQREIVTEEFLEALLFWASPVVLHVDKAEKVQSRGKRLTLSCPLSSGYSHLKKGCSFDGLLSPAESVEHNSVRVPPLASRVQHRKPTRFFRRCFSKCSIVHYCITLLLGLFSFLLRDRERGTNAGRTVPSRTRIPETFSASRWLANCIFALLVCLSSTTDASDISNAGPFSSSVWGWGGQPQSFAASPNVDAANYQQQPSWPWVQQQWGTSPQQYHPGYTPPRPQRDEPGGGPLDGNGERKEKASGEAFTDRSSLDTTRAHQDMPQAEPHPGSSFVRSNELTRPGESHAGIFPSAPQGPYWNTQPRIYDAPAAVPPASLKAESAETGFVAAPYRQITSFQTGEDGQAASGQLPQTPGDVLATYPAQSREVSSSTSPSPVDETRPAQLQSAPVTRPALEHIAPVPSNALAAQDPRLREPSLRTAYPETDRRQQDVYDSGRVIQAADTSSSPSWRLPVSSVPTSPETLPGPLASQGSGGPRQQEEGHADVSQDRRSVWSENRPRDSFSPQQNTQTPRHNDIPLPEKVQKPRTIQEPSQIASQEPRNPFQNPSVFPGMIPQGGFALDGRAAVSPFAWNFQQGQSNALFLPSSPIPLSPSYLPAVSPPVGFFPPAPPHYHPSPLNTAPPWHPTLTTLPKQAGHQLAPGATLLPASPEILSGNVPGGAPDSATATSLYPHPSFALSSRPTPAPPPSFPAPWMVPSFPGGGSSSPWLQVFNYVHMAQPVPSSSNGGWLPTAPSTAWGGDTSHTGELQQERDEALKRQTIHKLGAEQSIEEGRSASARGTRAIEQMDRRRRAVRYETNYSDDDSSEVEYYSTDAYWHWPGPRASLSVVSNERQNRAMAFERELQGTSRGGSSATL